MFQRLPIHVQRRVLKEGRALSVRMKRRLPYGLHQCENSGSCSWREFAEQMARILDRTATLEPLTPSNGKLRGPRIILPDWRDVHRRWLAGGRAALEARRR
jgi:hypothetical protein